MKLINYYVIHENCEKITDDRCRLRQFLLASDVWPIPLSYFFSIRLFEYIYINFNESIHSMSGK